MLDRLGCDAQVGMALYTGRLGLAEAFQHLAERPAGRSVADGRGRRAWGSARLLPFGPRVAARRAGAGQGSITRAPAASGSRARPRARPRSCCGSMPTAIATACASRCVSNRPVSATSAHAPAGARTAGWARSPAASARVRASAPEGSYTARLLADPDLLAAKLREEETELAEAADRAPRSTRPPTSSISRSRPSPATTSTSPRSSARSRGAPSSSPAGNEGCARPLYGHS